MCYTEWMYNNSLCHYGTQGMKWGVRRYQYEDGRYTPEGESRRLAKLHGGSYKINSRTKSKTGKKNLTEAQRKKRNKKIALGAAAGIAAVGIGALGVHKANQIRKGRKQVVSMMNNYYKYGESARKYAKMMQDARAKGDTEYAKELAKRYKEAVKKKNISRNRYAELSNKKNNSKYLDKNIDKLRSKGKLQVTDEALSNLSKARKRKRK